MYYTAIATLISLLAPLQLLAISQKLTLPITHYAYAVTANLDRAAQALGTVTVKPGETFSLNGALGRRTAATGYRKAPVFGGNGVVLAEFGGGLCMVSSILYNISLLAGLEVVERHPHQRIVLYTAAGLDAAIDYGRKDLRLRNPHAYPVSFRLVRHGKYLTAELSGSGLQPGEYRIEREVAKDMIPGELEPGFRVRTIRMQTSTSGTIVRKEILSQDTFLPTDRVTDEGQRP